jgi:hypothetical protein
MRMPKLEGRDRRAVLLGGAVLGPALLWVFAVAPYLAAVGEAADRLAAERRMLRGDLELLASASEYPKAFDAGAERLLAAAPRLMSGDDEGAAVAALAGYVRRMAQAGGANLTRVEPAAATDAGGGVRALPVGVTGETDLEGLLTFLQLLETGPKLLHVQELRIEAAAGASAQQAGGAAYLAAVPSYAQDPGAQPEVITFHFTATAFTLAAPADTSAAKGTPAPAEDADGGRSGVAELRDAEGGGR